MAKKGQKQKARRQTEKGGAKERKSSPGSKTGTSDASGGHRGLVNLGNTCFLNSMLQCLTVSSPFSDELMSIAKGFVSGSLCSSLCTVFKGIRGQESKGGAVSPKPLLTQLISKFPWYRGGEQQDAHELLRTLLGSISDEATSLEKKASKAEGKAPPRPPGTPAGCCEKTVWDNFRGHWAVAALCWGCGNVSIHLDPFLDISLELPSSGEPLGALGVPASARKPTASGAKASSSSSKAAASRKEGKAMEKPTEKAAPEDAEAVSTDATSVGDLSPVGSNGSWRQAATEAAQAMAAGSVVAATTAARQLVAAIGERAIKTVFSTPADELAAAEGAPTAEELAATEKLRAELKSLRPSALRKRAEALNVDSESLDVANDSDDSKSAMIELIVAATAAGCVAEVAAPMETFEVQLSREGKGKKQAKWGFSWNSEEGDQGRLIVLDVLEDSIVDSWNIKRITLGDQERCIMKGDRILAIDKTKGFDKMQKLLKVENDVCLTVVHEAASSATSGPSASGGKAKHATNHNEADEASQNKQEEPDAKSIAEAREIRRQHFCAEADRCEATLATALRDVFVSPDKSFPASVVHDVAEVGAVLPTKKKAARPQPVHVAELQAGLPSGSTCDLSDCFRQFSGVEALEDDFAPSYQCTDCMKEDESKRCFASRRVWLWAPLPRLFTVQLKRFQRRGQRFEKSSAKVQTPEVLDVGALVMTEKEHGRLSPHLISDSVTAKPTLPETALRYELYGVCVHIGSTMHNGHYIAYVNAGCSLASENWYSISDSKVSKCSRQSALEAEAYVAFYRREDVVTEKDEEEGVGEASSGADDGDGED